MVHPRRIRVVGGSPWIFPAGRPPCWRSCFSPRLQREAGRHGPRPIHLANIPAPGRRLRASLAALAPSAPGGWHDPGLRSRPNAADGTARPGEGEHSMPAMRAASRSFRPDYAPAAFPGSASTTAAVTVARAPVPAGPAAKNAIWPKRSSARRMAPQRGSCGKPASRPSRMCRQSLSCAQAARRGWAAAETGRARSAAGRDHAVFAGAFPNADGLMPQQACRASPTPNVKYLFSQIFSDGPWDIFTEPA
jgi:hypothetical protein